ncbi:E3 ubiquitin-protein ligase TRIM39-like [Gymnodraco acuticeps]|uniref:E3 ubiquitin-protein ligase TRIM39-like n=1 Tax=Gymnodraco acuticeps TaxID=8218 RepID=A0A6P8SWJ8_GYMAC|nr:E3 ubiquitin-protein ligase TRIM39-like [Gymnodraco acuticeps]
MAAASYLPSEDQFLCSICLDLFTDPVSTSCGHNFCKDCITEHWDTSDRCQCPMCKKEFNTRPELHVNTFISEMVAQFRQSAQQKARSSSSSEQQVFKAGEVPCDVCTETKLKALKSCLVCLTSYCETHLEPHLTKSVLKRHQLIDPVENLEDRMCPKHDKPLELFCKTDQTCVCMLCTVSDHKMHDVVPLKEEYEDKKAELGKTEAKIQQMIQRRRLKIQEIKHSVDLTEKDADREVAELFQVFTALKESVERLINTIKEKQKETEKKAETLIKELDLEISQLKKRSAKVEHLSRSEDHLHVLQGVKTLNIQHPSPTKDWTKVSIPPPSYEGTVENAVAQLEQTLTELRKLLEGTVVRAVVQLEETFSQEMKELIEPELKDVQKYAVNVTLDPDTAHPNLILSGGGKRVSLGDVTTNLAYNPKRFHYSVCVLGKQSFSSGTFYYEVQVKGKTDWELGVARESINRMGKIRLSPQRGIWIAWLRNGNEYKALDDPPVLLSLKSQPQKVGVFVDYEEGLVSFYDVDVAALIYSFTGCSFTEKLFPYFSPCVNDGTQNSAPLIISPVRVN